MMQGVRVDCVNPALGERLLEKARGGRSALPRELAAHAAECAECAVALERGRRMVAAMRELKPTRAEIAAARARYVARRGRGGVRRAVPLVVAFGSLLFTALAFAGAVRFAVVHGMLGGAPVKEATVPIATATTRAPSGVKHAGPRAASTSEETEIVPGAPVSPAAASSPISSSAPTPATTPTSTPTSTPASPRASATQPPPPGFPSANAGPSISASATAPAAPSPWVVAADAMRAHDYATAERAFADLATSSDPTTRDEARLARAQVWLAEGHAGSARPELTALASGGATTLVRERAAEALRSLGGVAAP